jgi:energy-coupling factor transporter transmembrane protein EcfT
MKKTGNFLRIIGQSIMLIAICLVGFCLIYPRIPGYNTSTDHDAGPWYFLYVTFIILTSAFLINTIIFLYKKHWKVYRLLVLSLITGLIISIFTPRKYILRLFLGEMKVEYRSVNTKNLKYYWIQIELFDNNNFLSSSSNYNLTIENIGKYELSEELLILQFENKQSDFMGKEFKINQDTLYCKDCKSEIKLIRYY